MSPVLCCGCLLLVGSRLLSLSYWHRVCARAGCCWKYRAAMLLRRLIPDSHLDTTTPSLTDDPSEAQMGPYDLHRP